jgi:hypothetical protein
MPNTIPTLPYNPCTVESHLTNLGALAVEDLRNLLERWAPCLDVQEVYEDDFECDPALMRTDC